MVGISAFHASQQIEYWIQIRLQPMADEPLEAHWSQLQEQWFIELNAMAPMIAQYFRDQNIDDLFRMRYQANMPRMWFARTDQVPAGMVPLEKAPPPKDPWTSPDAEVVSYPSIPNESSEDHANLLFSGLAQGISAPKSEIPSGHIALVACLFTKASSFQSAHFEE
jgi:hypothetical protein